MSFSCAFLIVLVLARVLVLAIVLVLDFPFLFCFFDSYCVLVLVARFTYNITKDIKRASTFACLKVCLLLLLCDCSIDWYICANKGAMSTTPPSNPEK